jgi:hypothetical protein
MLSKPIFEGRERQLLKLLRINHGKLPNEWKNGNVNPMLFVA